MRQLPTGATARLDVKCWRKEMREDGRFATVSTIIPVIVEGKNAERVAGYLRIGTAVEVEGRVQGFEIETADGPTKACCVVARRVERVKHE
jgi:single-stranded DNA-binding protein